jgi:hypothetical protein
MLDAQRLPNVLQPLVQYAEHIVSRKQERLLWWIAHLLVWEGQRSPSLPSSWPMCCSQPMARRMPYKKALPPAIQSWFRVPEGVSVFVAAFPHFCMHTQTQVPWDRPNLMQTYNLWNCVLIGYTTYAQPYLPKSLRKIIEYSFFS